jgi:transposase
LARTRTTLRGFFDLVGQERCAKIRLVSADGAEWIADVVAERCSNATLCIDAFHVCQWASKALDEVRRQVRNDARNGGMSQHARELKGCRYALWRNPEDLTPRQARELAWIAKVNTTIYRAYLMKEQLRIAIRTKGVLALIMLDEWLAWAQRCRIPSFVELGRKIKRNILGIEAAMLNNLSNALVERTNTKLRVLNRMAFGSKEPEHLIALALLDRGGYCPLLPGRPAA